MKTLIIMNVLGIVCCVLFGVILTSPISKITRSTAYCNGEPESLCMYNYQNVTDKIYQKHAMNIKLRGKSEKLTVCFGPNSHENNWIVITDKIEDRNSDISTKKKKLLLENIIACKISKNNEFVAKGFYSCFGSYKCMDVYFETGLFSYWALIIKDFFGKIFNSNVCL
jgi:hypothetical protein